MEIDRISILDCTLRDGGYCNQWKFGNRNINKIINNLLCSNIDIIECGILKSDLCYSEDATLFNNIEQIKKYINEAKSGKLLVCLANYGFYDFKMLPRYDGNSIDGVRIAFHKKDLQGAIRVCKIVKNKGYKVFLQPMVTLNYTDEEFLAMIKAVNEVAPFAFYIVDSFGAIVEKELMKLFLIADTNLNSEIVLGFHSHNNMQLAYANAMKLTEIHTKRKLIIDCSVMGMGRGAGNLNTELFVEYMNVFYERKKYNVEPLLVIIDQILDKFYRESHWGYSLANYLSARHNLHPNYAKYLNDKQTLTVEDIDNIFSMMDKEKKEIFDKNYIEKLYLGYLGKDDEKIEKENTLKKLICDKIVLIIAPGSSSEENKNRIIDFAKEDKVITVSINFDYCYLKTDYIFVSNLRRYGTLSKEQKRKCIVTSNIPANDVFIKTKYTELLNDNEFVRDNAGMMLIKYLINLGVKRVVLAGMDGYSDSLNDNNYYDNEMSFLIKVIDANEKNKGMSEMLKEFAKKIDITFLTESKHVAL